MVLIWVELAVVWVIMVVIYIYIQKYGTTWVNIVYNIEYYGFIWAAITDMVDIRHAHTIDG